MTDALGTAALLVTGAALLSTAATLLATGRVLVALGVLLDLLLAAGLLRLASSPTVAQLGSTALLVLVKRLASAGLRLGPGARPAVPGPVGPAAGGAGPAGGARRR